jgi:hypothetical protein
MLRTDSRVVDTAKFGLRSLSALSAAARLRRGRSPAGTDSHAGDPSVISPSLAYAKFARWDEHKLRASLQAQFSR